MQLKIKQIRSIIDRPKRQKLTIEALGLGRPNWERVHNDTPQIRGMINRVIHLVEVSEFESGEEPTSSPHKPVVRKTKKSTSSEKNTTKKKATAKKTVTKTKKGPKKK
jgi:large subunit ribosomal protein L30